MTPILIISNSNREIMKYINHSLKNSGDMFFKLEKSTTEYSINDIKDLIKKTKIFFAQKRIYLIEEFDASSLEAQNALLKILEEPPNNVLFVLSTKNENKIIPTIRSRTKLVKLKNKAIKELSSNMIRLLEKNTLFGHEEFETKTKDEAIQIMDQLLNFYRQKNQEQANVYSILKEILRLRNYLLSNNLNPQLTVDHLLLFIEKKNKIN